VKTILACLLLGCVALTAQVPPASSPAEVQANHEEALRQALRRAVNSKADSPAITVAANAVPEAGAADAAAPPAFPTVPPRLAPATPGGTNRPVLPVAPAPGAAAPPVIPAIPTPAVPAPGTPPGPGAPTPAAPVTPGAAEAGAAPAIVPSGANAGEDMIPPGVINFQAVDLSQVFIIYAELVNRTILRPTTLPAPVITLKTQTALTKREAIQALDTVLGMNGIAMINVGDKFVKAVPSATAGTAGARQDTRTNSELPELGQYVTHVYQTKYARPSELVPVLQPFANIPNSILPIDSSQILVLRDFTENVKRMLELIERVDVVVPSEFDQEVIPIKYALASEIANALNSLSSGASGTTVGRAAGGTGGRTGGFGAGGTGSFGRPGGVGTGGAYPGGVNPGGIGQPNVPQAATTPGGSSFSDRLQNIIKRASTSGEIQILGQTKIIADERTNSLLIFASKEDLKRIKDIVSKLDVVLAQVLIEAVIIEVQLGPDSKNFGVSYLQHPKSAGNFSGVGAGGAGTFFNPGSFASVGTNAGNALTGGFNYFGQWNNDLDVSVTAISSDSRAKILQRPRIQTSHAVQAQLFVGQSRPYPTSTYYGGGAFGGSASIQQLQIGVTLDVTPLINPDGLVVMDIHQTIESYNGDVDIANVGKVPITSRKEAAAKVAVRDRDTIILGGLIENDKSSTKSGIPFLMDIPVLGYLFRSTGSSQTRTELIVLLRPTVLPTPEIAALTARSEKDKMPGVKQTEREIMEEEAKRLKKIYKEEKRIY